MYLKTKQDEKHWAWMREAKIFYFPPVCVCTFAHWPAVACFWTHPFLPFPQRIVNLDRRGGRLAPMCWWTIFCVVKNRNYVYAAGPCFSLFLQLLRWSVKIIHAREIPPATPTGTHSRSRERGCHPSMPGASARSRPNCVKVQLFRRLSIGPPAHPCISLPTWKISVVAICCFSALPHILSLLRPPPRPILLTEPLFFPYFGDFPSS